MEVLLVENAPGFGGSLTGILHLVDAFPSWLHPTLICPYDPRSFVDVPDRLRVEVVSIDAEKAIPREEEKFAATLSRFAYRNVWPWAREVKRIARKYGASLIHGNNLLLGNFGAAIAGWRLGIPVISHQKGYEHNGRLVRGIIQQRWYAHHIATSHSIADHLQELGVPDNRCSMIYDAIIPPEFKPAPSQNSVPVVAMHSVLRRSKGQAILLRAVAKLRRENPGLPFRVVIAGVSPTADTYMDELRSLATELGIADQVEFPGHVRKPYDFLRGVDISVHASTEPEPFGRVAAESMIVGVPVIAAAGSGAAEYVEAAQAGLTTRAGDVDALAEALSDLLSSPQRRETLGAMGLQYARETFAPSVIARQVVDLYEDIVGGRAPRETLASVQRSAIAATGVAR